MAPVRKGTGHHYARQLSRGKRTDAPSPRHRHDCACAALQGGCGSHAPSKHARTSAVNGQAALQQDAATRVAPAPFPSALLTDVSVAALPDQHLRGTQAGEELELELDPLPLPEPFKIKMIEPIHLLPQLQRRALLASCGHNVFGLRRWVGLGGTSMHVWVWRGSGHPASCALPCRHICSAQHNWLVLALIQLYMNQIQI